MSVLDAWRNEIRPLIPQGFLRRAQGDGLFVSDYPRLCHAEQVTASLTAQGFCVEINEGRAFMDGDAEKYRALAAGLLLHPLVPTEQELPLYALGLRLYRRDLSLLRAPLACVHLTLKCLDAGQDALLLQRLPPQLAVLQRTHAPLPTLAGALIIDELHRRRGE